VYADWYDAAEAVNRKPEAATGRSLNRMGGAPRTAAAAGGSGGEGLGDDFIVDDEQDAEGEYADDE
jgi:hypothetical protein